MPTASTDVNGNVSSISYQNNLLGAVDPFGRAGTIYSPYVAVEGTNKRQTAKTYYEDGARRTRVESDLFNEGDALLKTRESRDQLGRAVLMEKNENGANVYTIFSQTVYKPQTYLFSDEAIKYWTGISDIKPDNPFYIRFKFWTITGIFVGIAGTIIFAFFHFAKQKRHSKLEAELQTLKQESEGAKNELAQTKHQYDLMIDSLFEDFFAIANGICISMARELGFGSITSVDERISFYVFDKPANCFILLSRHSENTEFNSMGHPSYEGNIVIIGKVWKNKFWFCNDYPYFDTAKNKKNTSKERIVMA